MVLGAWGSWREVVTMVSGPPLVEVALGTVATPHIQALRTWEGSEEAGAEGPARGSSGWR